MSKAGTALPGKTIMKAGLPTQIKAIMEMTDPIAQRKALDQFLHDLKEAGIANRVAIDEYNLAAIEFALRKNAEGKVSHNFFMLTAMYYTLKEIGNVRHNRFKEWVSEVTPAIWSDEAKGFKLPEDSKTKTYTEEDYDLETAASDPYWKKKEIISVPFNRIRFRDEVQKLLDKSVSDKADPRDQQVLKALAEVLEPVLLQAETYVKELELTTAELQAASDQDTEADTVEETPADKAAA